MGYSYMPGANTAGSQNYNSGGLQDLLDRFREGGGAKAAGIAGSLIPKSGFGNVAGGALSGAATGSTFGPVGTAIGAVVGGIGGAVNWKQQQHQKQMEALQQIRGRMS